MKRRDFLKRTSALGAVTILANPKSARSAVANDRIQLAIIGCGARSDWVCRDMMIRRFKSGKKTSGAIDP
ncbi:MAG: twin-arginine translocation signal domain-containing protein [Planctomycetia bacterium]|nr:twin-arginine translocation signal domain-containing protein [Planctomycetia bacterium]